MRATGLPMRIMYATLATPVAGIAGFYFGVFLLTRVLPMLEGRSPGDPGWTEFVLSVLLAGAAAFTAFLFALTLPWHRLRRRRGRPLRIGLSALLVLGVSLVGAAEGVPLVYLAAALLWLALVLTFTFIRYGVRDRTRTGAGVSGAVRVGR